jgi:hypothetical protein
MEMSMNEMYINCIGKNEFKKSEKKYRVFRSSLLLFTGLLQAALSNPD